MEKMRIAERFAVVDGQGQSHQAEKTVVVVEIDIISTGTREVVDGAEAYRFANTHRALNPIDPARTKFRDLDGALFTRTD